MHLKAAVFDWAGTLVDHGLLGPMGAVVEASAEFGVTISVTEEAALSLLEQAVTAALG